ncbi:hypothetical protein [Thalassomonas haliotis]|uniref:Uncharacterized protein n=1 Tax=Thalassomonas haliotis TaxID=485448 RepID=A0ABY7VBA5_9GAMM|nr:hypothetical protein [Thalassomonas haliotis]WDE10616.1 hypothetical protein H3N35_20500 [Thalassomonas haliotis]
MRGTVVEYQRGQDKGLALPRDAIAGSNYHLLYQVYRQEDKINAIKADMPELAADTKLDTQALCDMALKVTAEYAKNCQ